MRKLLASFLAVFGVSSTAGVTRPEVVTIDPNTLHFSMPTVAADGLEFVVPSEATFSGAPQFHEDEWAQIEFFPRSRLQEIQQRLVEYKQFEIKHRSGAGWSSIYARSIERRSIVGGPSPAARLASVLGTAVGNSPILHIASRPLGQVQAGFSIEVGPDVFLYGQEGAVGVTTLGVILFSGADNQLLIGAFSKLNQSDGLILVDWRAQQILVSAATDGRVEVWQP